MIVRTGEKSVCRMQEGSAEWQLWSSFLKDLSWPAQGSEGVNLIAEYRPLSPITGTQSTEIET